LKSATQHRGNRAGSGLDSTSAAAARQGRAACPAALISVSDGRQDQGSSATNPGNLRIGHGAAEWSRGHIADVVTSPGLAVASAAAGARVPSQQVQEATGFGQLRNAFRMAGGMTRRTVKSGARVSGCWCDWRSVRRKPRRSTCRRTKGVGTRLGVTRRSSGPNGKRATAAVTRYGCWRGEFFGGCEPRCGERCSGLEELASAGESRGQHGETQRTPAGFGVQ
jgi:hypothetical protein